MTDSPKIDPEVFFPPGSFFLAQIGGWTGRWVSAAQAFVRGGSYWTHAGVVLDHGEIIEAQPGGAVISPVEKLLDLEILISDEPVQRHVERAVLPLLAGVRESHERKVREQVVSAARSLEGTPYSFLDYLALVAVEARLPGSQRLRGYVESSGHLICSALVDRAYSMGGIHLFDDGRFPGDVTPGDLDRWVTIARRVPEDYRVIPGGPLDPATATLRAGKS